MHEGEETSETGDGPDIRKDLARVLRERGMTIAQLSAEVGVARTTLSSILSGKLTPKRLLTSRLAIGLQGLGRGAEQVPGETNEEKARHIVLGSLAKVYGSQADSKSLGEIVSATDRLRRSLPVERREPTEKEIRLEWLLPLLLGHFQEEADVVFKNDARAAAIGDSGGLCHESRDPSPADKAWAEHISGLGYQMSIGCRSGHVIGVAVEGTFILAARSAGKGFWTLPSCTPGTILDSGGVIFRLAPVVDPKELPAELHARFSDAPRTGEVTGAGPGSPAEESETELRLSSGKAGPASPASTETET